jgi:DNA-binding XRE family transcriptional regulator
MSLDDLVPAFGHTCTWEERRFGTCRCRPVTTQVNEPSRPPAQESDRRPDQELAPAEHKHPHLRAEFMQHLTTAPCHDRLRVLRIAMRWTQRKLAQELGISRRSLIRYEKAQHRSPWPRRSVLLRLRQVEAEHEQQLLGHFAGLGNLWLHATTRGSGAME